MEPGMGRSLNIRKMIRESFIARMVLILSVFIVVVTAAFTGFIVYSLKESDMANLLREGELLTWLLAYNSRLGVFSENDALLTEVVEGIFGNSKVLRASIFNPDGLVLKRKIRQDLSNDSIDGTLTDREKVFIKLRNDKSLFIVEKKDTLEFWAPVFSTSSFPAVEDVLRAERAPQADKPIIGFVTTTLTKEIHQRVLRLLFLKGFILGLVFFLTGSAAAYLLAIKITRPLIRLTENVNALGRGGGVHKIEVESQDEIGTLAAAFNEMAESLKSREKEKMALEEQLGQSQKMEAIGTLAGGIAHDFNNLLTTIIGYSEVLENGVDKEGKKYLEQILKAANKAANLTKSLLAFSRRQMINPKPMDLNENIRNVRKLLTRLISEDIEMEVELAPEELIIMADAGQIDQLVMNLVTNARDAMPKGGTLTVKSEMVEPDEQFRKLKNMERGGRHACLSVSDTGVGIAPEIKSKIFDPFFTTKGVGRGTGLGLSMVFGIVRQHGGIIDVQSQLGQGTTFSIYFPLIESAIEEEKKGLSQLLSGGKETVLLAEDDAQLRELIKAILERFGYQVIEACDGEDAVSKFRQESDRIKILITDVIMPKKNGKEVYDEIVKLKPGIRALFMSGYANDIISTKGVINKDLNFIVKPVSTSDIIKKVREILDTPEGEAQIRA